MRIGQRVTYNGYFGTVVDRSPIRTHVYVSWDNGLGSQSMRVADLTPQPQITEYPAHLLIHEADGSCRVAPPIYVFSEVNNPNVWPA
jgi:hypothetical protein